MTTANSSGNNSEGDEKKEILYIIKIGGNVIDEEKSLHPFLKVFSAIKAKKILVHGGGKIATAIGDQLGIQSKYIDGRRITDDETIDLVTMVYGGLVNKKIVAYLQSVHCNAIGLSGADANVLPAKKRPVKSIDYGWVGDVIAGDIDTFAWKLFLENTLVPVLAPLTHNGEGKILNTNADTMASVLAASLSNLYCVKLIYCFEKNGVLSDVSNDKSVIDKLDAKTFAALKDEKQLFAGILPKIDNAFDALNNGADCVLIGNSIYLKQLVKEESGTKIVL